MLIKTQLVMSATMLELASDAFANHGSNDFYLDNTPENREFVREVCSYIGIPIDEIYISLDNQKIIVMDTHIMDYCKSILLKAAKEQIK